MIRSQILALPHDHISNLPVPCCPHNSGLSETGGQSSGDHVAAIAEQGLGLGASGPTQPGPPVQQAPSVCRSRNIVEKNKIGFHEAQVQIPACSSACDGEQVPFPLWAISMSKGVCPGTSTVPISLPVPEAHGEPSLKVLLHSLYDTLS